MSSTQTTESQVAEGFVCSSCGAAQERLRFCIRCGSPTGLTEPALAPVESAQSEMLPESLSQPPRPVGVRVPAYSTMLPRVAPRGGTRTLHWVGVHGGAGESTLAIAMPGSTAAGHGWPVEPSGPGGTPIPVPVVLVARSHGTGLIAAQNALREWAAGAVAPARLLGLVVIADSPVRLPKELREMQRLVAGGAPNFWTIPYIDALRLGPDELSIATLDARINRVRRAIQALIDNL